MPTSHASLAEALHLLGRSIDPNSITQVHFNLIHSPADMPGLGQSWIFTATLKGTKGLGENGEQVLSFEQSWKGEADSDEEAFKKASKAVLDYTLGFQTLRQQEATFAEQAAMTIANTDNLKDLWTSADPLTPMAEEAERMDDQTSAS